MAFHCMSLESYFQVLPFRRSPSALMWKTLYGVNSSGSNLQRMVARKWKVGTSEKRECMFDDRLCLRSTHLFEIFKNCLESRLHKISYEYVVTYLLLLISLQFGDRLFLQYQVLRLKGK